MTINYLIMEKQRMQHNHKSTKRQSDRETQTSVQALQLKRGSLDSSVPHQSPLFWTIFDLNWSKIKNIIKNNYKRNAWRLSINCSMGNINSILFLTGICSEPPRYGTCKAQLRKWHYISKLKKCKPFIYSGCGGNENRFYNKMECEEYCQIVGRFQSSYTNSILTLILFQ